MKKLTETARLVSIVTRLRKECPWDRKQTHRSLLPYLLEEAHETYEAIQSKKPELMKEELGDLLLQIVLHAELATEKNNFDMEAVSKGIADKMVRRHPHVFDKKNFSTKGHSQRWIQQKKKENPNRTLLSGVPKSLPSLQVASRYGEIASSVGFDWSSAELVFDKVKEELGELQVEVRKLKKKKGVATKKAIEEELGDLFFSLANFSRHLGIDPEGCARKGARKFSKRFTQMELQLKKQGLDITDCSAEQLEREWEKVKKNLK